MTNYVPQAYLRVQIMQIYARRRKFDLLQQR